MAVFQTPVARLKEVQETFRAEHQQREPTIANVEAVTTAHDEGRLTYRGRTYRTRPTDYRSGLELAALSQELDRLAEMPAEVEYVDRSIKVVRAMLDIFYRLIYRPWWMRKNPFLDAELEEVQLMRSFFCTARTKLRANAVASIRAPHWLQRTWPITLRPLSIGIPAGWDRMATLVAGDTINLVR